MMTLKVKDSEKESKIKTDFTLHHIRIGSLQGFRFKIFPPHMYGKFKLFSKNFIDLKILERLLMIRYIYSN